MYLRPDEVARVLEKVGFTVDVVTQKAYGYRRGENYVYVNREARMGRTALVIHPTLKERSSTLAEPASDIKTCDHYQQFPLYLACISSSFPNRKRFYARYFASWDGTLVK